MHHDSGNVNVYTQEQWLPSTACWIPFEDVGYPDNTFIVGQPANNDDVIFD